MTKTRKFDPDDPSLLFSNADIRKLLIPLLLEQALAVLIGMMDTVMVSSCGEAAVSGVSLVDSINVLLINVMTALATGGAVVSAQLLGKKDRDGTQRAAKMLFYVILIFSTAITVFCLLTRRPLLRLIFGTIEQDVMENALTYFLITALSYPFLAFYNAAAALLRSMNRARDTLKVSIIMNLINCAGNAILIYGAGIGVAGAALATLASRIVGAILIWFDLKNPECTIPRPHLLQPEWDGDMVHKILSVGIPNGLEGGIFQFGKLLLLSIVSTFGTASIAANAVANTYDIIHILPGSAIGLAMYTVVGQCVGAGDYDQAKWYAKRLMILTYLLMGTLNIIMLLLTPWVCIPFNLSEETASIAVKLIVLHGAGCVVLWPMAFTLPHALRAAGDTMYAMIISVVSMVAFRLVSGYVLGVILGYGVVGVWVAMQIDWVFRIIMFLRRWFSGKWLTKAVV